MRTGAALVQHHTTACLPLRRQPAFVPPACLWRRQPAPRRVPDILPVCLSGSCRGKEPAFAVCLSGGYEDDEDRGGGGLARRPCSWGRRLAMCWLPCRAQLPATCTQRSHAPYSPTCWPAHLHAARLPPLARRRLVVVHWQRRAQRNHQTAGAPRQLASVPAVAPRRSQRMQQVHQPAPQLLPSSQRCCLC